MRNKLVLVFLMIGLSHATHANEPLVLDTEEKAKAYQSFIKEIRCITCPNQNISETDGGIAKVIRHDIMTKLNAGETPDAIRAYLRESYGEHISYRPDTNLKNSFLWLAPLFFGVMGFSAWRKMHASK